ncbi:MAG: hypothetical protein R6V73_11600 [Anaerolineales bacterium]
MMIRRILPPFLRRRALLPRRSLVPVLRQAAPTGPAIQDSFTDTDGVTLPGHVPDLAPAGSSWSNTNLGVINNQVHYLNSATRQLSVIQTGISDCIISVRCCQDANGSASTGSEYRSGIIARYSATNSFWRIAFHPVAGFAIYEVNAGVAVARAATVFTTEYGAFHTVQAELVGESILGKIDGAYPISYDLASFNKTASIHGLMIGYSGSVPAVDDFLVERI